MSSKNLLALTPALVLCAACHGSTPASNVPVADRAHAQAITDASQLIGGPKASGQVGDILLANTHVRFIIEAQGRSRSWFPVTGALLDADRVRPAGEAGQDRIQEVVTRLGNLGVLDAETVEIANDGSDGNPAVVRVTGHDVPVPILQSVAPQSPIDVHAVTEYRLSPYDDSLEIDTTVTDQSGADQVIVAGEMFILGDFVTLFAPGVGTDRSQLTLVKALRYFASFGGAVSYGYSAPGRTLDLLVPQAEIFGTATDNLSLPAKGSASFSRRFTIGTGDVASLLPEIVKRESATAPALSVLAGKVTEQHTGAAVAGAQVGIANSKGPYAIAVTGSDGSFQAPLEAGSYSYSVSAAAHATSASATLDFSAPPATPLAITLNDTGRFALAISDGDQNPQPARVQLSAKDGTGWGYVLSPDGKGGGELPPGDYVAVGSRGYEFEVAQVNFTVTAGQTVDVPMVVNRVVDTSGYIALDSHTHTAISVDSELDPAIRVAQALGDGVEFVISTDHDVVFDLKPTIADVASPIPLATIMGCEVSPVPGHINGFPATLSAASDTNGYWPVEWWSEDADQVFIADLWPKDIFAGIRSKLGAELVQINHPRSSQGVLNWVGYSAAHGLPSVDPTQFDMNWDAIEVCNAGCDRDLDSDDGRTLTDWYSFLNQGYARTAVGVSDSHTSDNFLGTARTMVAVRNDDPTTLDTEEVLASLKAGNASVTNGAFVVVTALDDGGNTVEMGGLAKATGAQVTLHVRVQAPSWIATDRIHIVQNGVDAEVLPLTFSGAPPVVRYDADVVVPGTPSDAWYVVIVDGDAPMAPVMNSQPRSITNAIRIDRNGNGTFEAPGL